MSDLKAETDPIDPTDDVVPLTVYTVNFWDIEPEKTHFFNPKYDGDNCQLGLSLIVNPNETSVLRFRPKPTGNAYLDAMRNEWYPLFVNYKTYLCIKTETRAEIEAEIEAENPIVVNRESSKEETNNFSSCINLTARDSNYVELSNSKRQIRSKLIHREKKMKRDTKVTSRNNFWQNFQEPEQPISVGKKFLCGKCSYCEKNDDWNHLYINECSDDDSYDNWDDWDDKWDDKWDDWDDYY